MRIARILLVLSLTSLGGLGCAGASDDDILEGSEGALDEHAGLVGKPPQVTSSSEITPEASASAKLLGHIPNVTVDQVTDKLVDFGRWKEIKNGETFSASSKSADTTSGDRRTIRGEVTTVELGFTLPVIAEVTTDGNTKTVKISNSAKVTFLTMEVIKPGKFAMTLKLIPHKEGGVVVDGAVQVKLERKEDKASKVTRTLLPLFAWLSK